MKTNNPPAELTVCQRIGLELLWGFSRGFAMLPYWLKYYVFEPILFFVLCDVVHYRRKVIDTNLRNSFPDRSDAERRRIRRRFYHILAEMFIDTLNLTHPSPRKLRRHFTIENLDEVQSYISGRDWIAVMAHYGCWELGSFYPFYDPSVKAISIYRWLHNPIFEAFYRRLRTTEYSLPVLRQHAMRFYLNHREQGYEGKRLALGMIADQSPPQRAEPHWFRFLNQDTVFFDGPEQLAVRYGMPVLFTCMQRVKRGCYSVRFELLYDGQEEVPRYEITGRYVRHLERMILDRPELWMWSHRRWKQKHDAEE